MVENPASFDGPASLAPLSTLLALQDESLDEPAPRSEFERGSLTLDKLEQLRLQLLTGEPDRQLLEGVERLARDRTDDNVTAEMREVLNEIEVRAAVELAKLDRKL